MIVPLKEVSSSQAVSHTSFEKSQTTLRDKNHDNGDDFSCFFSDAPTPRDGFFCQHLIGHDFLSPHSSLIAMSNDVTPATHHENTQNFHKTHQDRQKSDSIPASKKKPTGHTLHRHISSPKASLPPWVKAEKSVTIYVLASESNDTVLRREPLPLSQVLPSPFALSLQKNTDTLRAEPLRDIEKKTTTMDHKTANASSKNLFTSGLHDIHTLTTPPMEEAHPTMRDVSQSHRDDFVTSHHVKNQTQDLLLENTPPFGNEDIFDEGEQLHPQSVMAGSQPSSRHVMNAREDKGGPLMISAFEKSSTLSRMMTKIQGGLSSSLDHMKQDVKQGGKSGLSHLVRDLKPECLDAVRVKLKMHRDGHMMATFLTTNQSDLQTLFQVVKDIREIFQDSGFALNQQNLHFTSQDDHPPQDQSRKRNAGNMPSLLSGGEDTPIVFENSKGYPPTASRQRLNVLT